MGKERDDNVTKISDAKTRATSPIMERIQAHFESLPPEYLVSIAMVQDAADSAKIIGGDAAPKDGYHPLEAFMKWFPSLGEFRTPYVWEAMHSVLRKGTVIAVARPGKPHAEPVALPPDAWQFIKLQLVGLPISFHAKDQHGAMYYGVTLFPADQVPKRFQKGKVGRPQEHNWDGAFQAARAYIESNGGLPERLQSVVDVVREWFEANDGMKAPEDPEIRKRLQSIFAEFR